MALLTGASSGASHAAWLRRFEDNYPKGGNNDADFFQIKQLIRNNGIPDDLRRTIWPKLIKLHKPTSNQSSGPRRHSRSLSVNVTPSDFEGFHLNSDEQQYLKSVLFTFSGHVPPILQVLLAFLIKYCGCPSVDDFLSRMLPTDPQEYYFYPASKRDVLIFERVFEELLGKFSPSVMRRLQNLQLLVPDYAPQWEKLLFTFFLGVYSLEVSAKIFDCFLVEGYKVLLRFALAHCILREKRLAKCTTPSSFDHELLKNDNNLAWHDLIDAAFGLNFSRALVDRYRHRHRKLSDADLDPEDLRLLIQQTQKMPTLLQESNVCSDGDWANVWKWVPARFRMLHLDLVFRKSLHGGSMSSFYARCAHNEPLLIFVQTTEQIVVGAFLSKGFHNRPIRGTRFSSPFFGTGETFIFRLGLEPAAFNWTPGTPNVNYACADGQFLGFGCSEGKFGLWIGEHLSRVSCSHCITYNNARFTLDESDVYEMEVFKFV